MAHLKFAGYGYILSKHWGAGEQVPTIHTSVNCGRFGVHGYNISEIEIWENPAGGYITIWPEGYRYHERTCELCPETLIGDVSWFDQGACFRAPDPMLWFPGNGSPRPAAEICARCPVSEKCLEYGKATKQMAGVWGQHRVTKDGRWVKVIV